MAFAPVDVAVSVVRDSRGHVLLAERTARQVGSGFWELPGGKIDPGETASQAAARELAEETGLVAATLRPWITHEHAFRTKRVRLHVYHAEGWQGTPRGREGQRLAWVDPAAPSVAPLLPSNDRLMAALALPSVMAMVELATKHVLPAMLSSGARLIWVRGYDMAPDQRVVFCRRVVARASADGARVLLSGSALEAGRAGAGVHSCARTLRRLTARPETSLWAASCHDADDVARADSLGADLIVTGPVRGGAAPLGWNGFALLARSTAIATYARGEMTPGCLDRARAAGAHGIVLDGPQLGEAP